MSGTGQKPPFGLNSSNGRFWVYAWNQGPFQLLDKLGPKKFSSRIVSENGTNPKMLTALNKAGAEKFYLEEEEKFFSVGGDYKQIPAE